MGTVLPAPGQAGRGTGPGGREPLARETWPAVRAKAKRGGGEILSADEVGIRSDQVTGRTWGGKGRTPVVRRRGHRFPVNAMPTISSKGRTHLMVFAESFTAGVMCRFPDRLASQFDHNVHLVVDGHSAHRFRKVRDGPAAHPDDVELGFLPPYSPELNPDELVNADLKHSLPRTLCSTSRRTDCIGSPNPCWRMRVADLFPWVDDEQGDVDHVYMAASHRPPCRTLGRTAAVRRAYARSSSRNRGSAWGTGGSQPPVRVR